MGDRGHTSVYIEKCRISPNELVSCHCILIYRQQGIFDLTVKLKNACLIFHIIVSYDLHVQIIRNRVFSKDSSHNGWDIFENTRVNCIRILNADYGTLRILEVIIWIVLVNIVSKCLELRIGPVAMACELVSNHCISLTALQEN